MTKTMSPHELAAAPEGAYSIVDVRDHQVYLQGAPKGSINVPLNPSSGAWGQAGYLSPESALEMLKALPKDKPVAVVCYHGILSQYAAKMLQQLGYDAYSVAEGYAGYQAALARL